MARLDLVKAHLRVDGNEQDDLLNHLIESARAECCRYTGLADDDSAFSQPDVINGIILAVQADYDSDATQRALYLKAAHSLWTPYCRHYGV